MKQTLVNSNFIKKIFPLGYLDEFKILVYSSIPIVSHFLKLKISIKKLVFYSENSIHRFQAIYLKYSCQFLVFCFVVILDQKNWTQLAQLIRYLSLYLQIIIDLANYFLFNLKKIINCAGLVFVYGLSSACDTLFPQVLSTQN